MGTMQNFEDKKRYEISGYPISAPGPLNMWYNRVLYGKIDQQGNVVHVSHKAKLERRLKIVQPTDAFSNRYGDILLIDFVAVAFKKFQTYFVRGDDFGKVIRRGIIRDAIQKPTGGYIDAKTLYKSYVEKIYSIFSDTYLKTSVKTRVVQNFDDYSRLFIHFATEYAKTSAITKTFFIKNSICTPLISGLMVRLANEDHDSDEARGVWLSDPNFKLYTNTARQFGFMVDMHAPWRLIANITSPNMLKNWIWKEWDRTTKQSSEEMLMGTMVPGCINTTDSVSEWLKKPNEVCYKDFVFPETSKHFFDSYYTKSCFSDIGELKKNMVNNYNKFVEKNPRVKIVDTKRCVYGLKTDKLVHKVVTREQISMQAVDDRYDDDHWLKIYFYIRIAEEQVFFKEPKFRRILRSAQRMAKKLDKNSAVMYINRALREFPEVNSNVSTVPLNPTDPQCEE